MPRDIRRRRAETRRQIKAERGAPYRDAVNDAPRKQYEPQVPPRFDAGGRSAGSPDLWESINRRLERRNPRAVPRV